MNWKTIVVRESESIFLKNNQLGFFQKEKLILIPFHDIDCIVLENQATKITTQLLSRLAQDNIFLFVCDSKHDPKGLFLPFNTHWKPLKVLSSQLKVGVHFKNQIWTNLIKAKIENSRIVLKNLGLHQDVCQRLSALSKSIIYNDKNNNEGIAAGIFFRALYGSRFIRDADTGINRALNYGYKIIMSALSRSIAKYGITNYLGIHHRGQENPFNLACDLMEPFRPLVDALVADIGEDIHQTLNYNQRLELIKLLDQKVEINNHIHTVSQAIDLMTRSFLTALYQEDSTQIHIPRLLSKHNEYDEHI